jgi:hypothetical protein
VCLDRGACQCDRRPSARIGLSIALPLLPPEAANLYACHEVMGATACGPKRTSTFRAGIGRGTAKSKHHEKTRSETAHRRASHWALTRPLQGFHRFQPDRENENDVGLVERAAALPARLHSNRRQSDNRCARDRRPFRSRLTAVFTRHDFITTSGRAAISFVVRECRPAGD